MDEMIDALFEDWWACALDVGEWDESGWKPASPDARKAFAKGYELGGEAGESRTQEAVALWLREGLASSYPNGSTSRGAVLAAAEAIEAGEFRKP